MKAFNLAMRRFLLLLLAPAAHALSGGARLPAPRPTGKSKGGKWKERVPDTNGKKLKKAAAEIAAEIEARPKVRKQRAAPRPSVGEDLEAVEARLTAKFAARKAARPSEEDEDDFTELRDIRESAGGGDDGGSDGGIDGDGGSGGGDGGCGGGESLQISASS